MLSGVFQSSVFWILLESFLHFDNFFVKVDIFRFYFLLPFNFLLLFNLNCFFFIFLLFFLFDIMLGNFFFLLLNYLRLGLLFLVIVACVGTGVFVVFAVFTHFWLESDVIFWLLSWCFAILIEITGIFTTVNGCSNCNLIHRRISIHLLNQLITLISI